MFTFSIIFRLDTRFTKKLFFAASADDAETQLLEEHPTAMIYRTMEVHPE